MVEYMQNWVSTKKQNKRVVKYEVLASKIMICIVQTIKNRKDIADEINIDLH